MKKFLSVAGVTALLVFPSIVEAVTITFDNLTGANLSPYHGSTESGFTITPTEGTWLEGHIFGSPAPDIVAGPTCPICIVEEATIQITGVGVFNFVSFDAASNSAPSIYSVQGFLGQTIVYSLTGTLEANYALNISTVLSSNSGLVDSLMIKLTPEVNEQGNGPASIVLDNIVLGTGTFAVPESNSTLFLLAIVCAGSIFMRKLYRFFPLHTGDLKKCPGREHSDTQTA